MKRSEQRLEGYLCPLAGQNANPVCEKNLAPATSGALCGNVGLACSLLKAMANEDRLLLLCQLAGARLNVGELKRVTGIHQPTLSQQLGVLRQEGLVETEKEGRYVYYRLVDDNVARVMRMLWEIFCIRAPSCDST